MGRHHGPFQPAASKAKLQHPFSEVHGRQKRNGGVAVPINPRILTEGLHCIGVCMPEICTRGTLRAPSLDSWGLWGLWLHSMASMVVTQNSLREEALTWPGLEDVV